MMNDKVKTILLVLVFLFSTVNLPWATRSSSVITELDPSPTDIEVELRNLESLRMLETLSNYEVIGQVEEKDKRYYYNLEYMGGGGEQFKGSIIVKNLKLEISFDTQNSVRVKLTDRDNSRWEIPEEKPFPFFKVKDPRSKDNGCCEIDVTNSPFSLKITRRDNRQTIFDSAGLTFIYSDVYIEIGTKLPSDNIYGYGERNYKFKLGPGKYTIWGRDEPKVKEDGRGGANVYGHHPVGLVRDDAGSFFIMVMKNSNAMDVEITNSRELKYHMTGGVIDLIFFKGDEYPDTVIKEYHEFIGDYVMMPFWSMGHHQSRWGYKTINHHKNVLAKYEEHDIPLDVIWSDIDYMREKEDFTIDQNNFPVSEMRQMLQDYRKHWVPIIDAGVKSQNTRGIGYKEGIKRGIFVRNHKGDPLKGSVWPGDCHFVDFFNPKAADYWSDMLEELHKTIQYDGIWLDMNEIANFVHGEVGRYDTNRYDNLPYTPGGRQLKTKTLSMDAVHFNNSLEFDVHELHSILQNKATYEFLRKKSPLPFILTRSSSFGTGQFSAHWTGDNGADWDFLKFSLAGNFNFQIFGSPFVGADICGFMGHTTPELCSRWIQIGALYPFSRNHNELQSRDQEPWAFGNDFKGELMTKTYRESVKLRYSILKWFYSLFILARGRGSVWKPLIFEFPKEEILYKENFNELQFLMGSHVMVTPVLDGGKVSVDAYFPIATWFNYYTGERFIEKSETDRKRLVAAPLGEAPPLWVREGYIMHSQDITHVASTYDLDNKFELTIAFMEKGDGYYAEGIMMGIANFDDQSVSTRCVERDCLYKVKAEIDFRQKKTRIPTTLIRFDSNSEGLDELIITKLRIFGYPFEFLDEDEIKTSYALVEAQDSHLSLRGVPAMINFENIYPGCYIIDLPSPISVKPGYSIKVQIIMQKVLQFQMQA